MRMRVIRLVYAVALFFAVIIVMEAVSGTGGSATAGNMSAPTLPTVEAQTEGTACNLMFGQVSERSLGEYRAAVTPVAQDRKITLLINPYDSKVKSIAYEVRSLSGQRLIENGSIDVPAADEDGMLQIAVSLSDLEEENTEYNLVLLLTTDSRRDVRYYSRFLIEDSDQEKDGSKALEFVSTFHKETFDKGSSDTLLTYIEPDDSESNSNLAHVTISSSADQVTYGSLSPVEVQSPVFSITSIQGTIYTLRGDFVISADKGDGHTVYYDCTEYYRVNKGTDRFHLLAYTRTMQTIPDFSDNMYEKDRINLGIGDVSQVEASEGGKAAAAVVDGRLIGVCGRRDAVSCIFSFAEAGSADVRENQHSYGIKILRVDDNGSTDFLVYGYMNRGAHEGETGISEYSYNAQQNTLEEVTFIPYQGGSDRLAAQVEKAAYLNDDGDLFLLLDETLVEVDNKKAEAKILHEELDGSSSAVSDGGEMIAYAGTKDEGGEGTIILTDLADMSTQTITPPSGDTAVPLGFIGNDLIYGLRHSSDETKDAAGNSYQPMYSVRIVDSSLKELENYTPDGYYISNCDIQDGQITLHRVVRSTDTEGNVTYTAASDDQIMNADAGGGSSRTDLIETGSDDVLETVYYLTAAGLEPKNLRYARPREIGYGDSREISLKAKESTSARYYVYDMFGYSRSYSTAAEAIDQAQKLSGVVVNRSGRPVWQYVPDVRCQIELPENTEDTDGMSSLAVCLTRILELEGTSADVTSMLNGGADAGTVLTKAISGAEAIDMTGCTLQEALYPTSQGTPVIAMKADGNAVLLLGYGPTKTAIYDPTDKKDEVEIMDIDKAQEMFAKGENIYIGYLRAE